MQCFNTDTFKEATRLVKVTGHTLSLPSHGPDGARSRLTGPSAIVPGPRILLG